MDIFSLLQIIIALIFIYFTVSLLVSEVQEQWAAVRQWRARNLEEAITIFAGKDFCKKLYQSDIFSSFNQHTNTDWFGKSHGPSYIKPEAFAELLLVCLTKASDKKDTSSADKNLFPTIIKSLDSIKDKKEYKKIVQQLKDIGYISELKYGDPTVEEFVAEIADTFNNIMERTSGVYKRNAKGVSLLLGFLAASIFNVDTLGIVDNLYKNHDLRQGFDQLATEIVSANETCLETANGEDEAIEACQKDLEARTKNLKLSSSENQSLPIGWNESWFNTEQIENEGGLGQKTLGWFISAIAVSMGAPFWFDLLGKVLNVRNTVRPLSSK